MVEQVEEDSAEAEVLPLAQFERFAQSEVHVLLRWSDDAVARRGAVNGRVAVSARGEGCKRVGLIRVRLYPVGQPRGDAAGAESVPASESRPERSCRQVRAAQGGSTAARRIHDGEGRTRLQGQHAAG